MPRQDGFHSSPGGGRSATLRILKLLRLIREELLLVLGTASGEVALPRLMLKLEQAGCDGAVVGFVLPGGYSFSLDGTSLYMVISVAFIARPPTRRSRCGSSAASWRSCC